MNAYTRHMDVYMVTVNMYTDAVCLRYALMFICPHYQLTLRLDHHSEVTSQIQIALLLPLSLLGTCLAHGAPYHITYTGNSTRTPELGEIRPNEDACALCQCTACSSCYFTVLHPGARLLMQVNFLEYHCLLMWVTPLSRNSCMLLLPQSFGAVDFEQLSRLHRSYPDLKVITFSLRLDFSERFSGSTGMQSEGFYVMSVEFN
eukprot:scpid104445/ scgid7315/ 